MHRSRLSALALCVALAVLAGGSARASDAAPVRAVRVGHSAQFTLHSETTGRDYLIQVAIPATPAPKDGYAVLYVLDGNLYWPLLRLAHQMFGRHGPYASPSPLLIVGIGYPDTARFDFDARAEDYTPPGRTAPALHADRQYGGAPAFLAFIRKQLQPAIQARYPVNSDNRALLGHSYGGLFVVYTLLTQPEAFDHYLAISPSLWWNRRYLEPSIAERHQRRTDIEGCALIGVGDRERPRRSAALPKGRTMADLDRKMLKQLQALYPNLKTRLTVFPGERHGTVMWPAARQALTFLDTCAGTPTQRDRHTTD